METDKTYLHPKGITQIPKNMSHVTGFTFNILNAKNHKIFA